MASAIHTVKSGPPDQNHRTIHGSTTFKTRLHIETARMDIARIKDPTIHGEMYQRGRLYDEENIKAYVFARDNYKCKV